MGRILGLAIVVAAIIAFTLHYGSGDPTYRAAFYRPVNYLPQALGIVALGLLAAQLGGQSFYIVAGLFLAMMAAGAFLAMRGMRLPEVDGGIALSVVVLGLLVALTTRTETWVALAVAALFGVAHGYRLGAPGSATISHFGGFLLAGVALIAGGALVGEMLARVVKTGSAKALLGAAIFGAGALLLAQRYGFA